MRDDELLLSMVAFDDWRQEARRQLKRFHLWLRRNQLQHADIRARLKEILANLECSDITLAFVGELSRGKTELINALFFADYGVRVLPSSVGRTTMCPTEIFYDRGENKAYLKLLPIETRASDDSLAHWLAKAEAWQTFELPVSDPPALAESLRRLTESIEVSETEAVRLGFQRRELTEVGRVEIPRWRHALVSYPHPLLVKGLRVIDTPGLNALGSEPELTLSLLPQAQAIVFVLAADAGVTASDMTLWEQTVEPLRKRPNLGVYVALNKADVLWDDLGQTDVFQASLDKLCQTTARQLNVPRENIMPVSARKALAAQARRDPALLEQSGFAQLREALAVSLLGNKRREYWRGVIREATQLVDDGIVALQQRQALLKQQRTDMEQLRSQAKEELAQLIIQLEDEREALSRQLQSLTPSRRLVDRQARVLVDLINRHDFEKLISDTCTQLLQAKTSVSILRILRTYQAQIIYRFERFVREAELANKLLDSVYAKFSSAHGVDYLQPLHLEAKKMQKRLVTILREHQSFRQKLVSVLTEQSSLTKRHFNVHGQQVLAFIDDCRRQTGRWARRLLLPLERQLQDRRQALNQHIDQLRAVQAEQASVQGRLQAIDNLLQEVEDELYHAEHVLEILHAAPDVELSNKVVPLRATQGGY